MVRLNYPEVFAKELKELEQNKQLEIDHWWLSR